MEDITVQRGDCAMTNYRSINDCDQRRLPRIVYGNRQVTLAQITSNTGVNNGIFSSVFFSFHETEELPFNTMIMDIGTRLLTLLIGLRRTGNVAWTDES